MESLLSVSDICVILVTDYDLCICVILVNNPRFHTNMHRMEDLFSKEWMTRAAKSACFKVSAKCCTYETVTAPSK